MLGAIIGDIVGSVYEFCSDKNKNFPLFSPGCSVTDDSIMTLAVALTCSDSDLADEEAFKSSLCNHMRQMGREYPDCGYGDFFYRWLMSDDMEAYNSYGNGSAMRVSPVAYAARTLEEAEKLAKWSAEVTHNHKEGIVGATAVAAAVFMALHGSRKKQIKEYIESKYYDLDFTLDQIRPSYRYDITCKGSVPQAIMCFLEAEDFEDAIRNAISLGGDGDTLAAIAGSIAEAYFKIPESIETEAFKYIDYDLTDIYYYCADSLY